MKSFRQFILSEGSGHLTHVEDSVLYSGVSGAKKAIQTLKSVRDSLTGKGNKPVSVTVKWDGAPAIFCGIDSADGKFFVATKSFFNKTPKLNFSDKDIEANHVHAKGLMSKITRGSRPPTTPPLRQPSVSSAVTSQTRKPTPKGYLI